MPTIGEVTVPGRVASTAGASAGALGPESAGGGAWPFFAGAGAAAGARRPCRPASPRRLARFSFDDAGQRLQGQLVALRPEAANHPARGEADIGMVAEALAPE